MKIRYDFITNSSSSAFVVFIPKNYSVSRDKIEETEEYKDFLDDMEPDQYEIDKAVSGILNNIKSLQKGEEIRIGPYDYKKLILSELLIRDNLVLREISVDGEGATTFMPITLTELKKFIKRVEKL